MGKGRVDISEFLEIKNRLGIRDNGELSELLRQHSGVIIKPDYFRKRSCTYFEFSAGVSAALRMLVKAELPQGGVANA